MKQVQIVMGVLIAAMLLLSCGDDRSESHRSDDAETHSSHSVSIAPGDGIRLNDGRRWEMDDHTRSSFEKMAASFSNLDYASLEGEGLKDAGSDLQGGINELIQGCTMTGGAHDQLHEYLTGYISAVASLSASGRIEDAEKVEHFLEKYGEYFE